MSNSQIKVPDIGADSAEVIEVLIAEGDSIEAEQSVIVLESDKASMEVPAPASGKVGKLHVKVGDTLSEGDVIADLESGDASAQAEPEAAQAEPVEETAAKPDEAEPSADKPAAAASEVKAFKVPDIGSDTAEVIEVNVAIGDEIEEGDTICVAESDKASLEVPAEASGKVVSVSVKEGDSISEGADLIEIEVQGVAPAASKPATSEPAKESAAAKPAAEAPAASGEPEEVTWKVPDIGSDSAEVIEVNVAVGDAVSEGDTLCVAESDKASLEVPAESDGEIVSVSVKVGDSISQGDALVVVKVAGKAPAAAPKAEAPAKPEVPAASENKAPPAKPAASAPATASAPSGDVYAGPAVRKLARELGVDLAKVPSTGARGRILKDDLHNFVKQVMSSGGAAASGGSGVPAAPVVDWSKFGPVRSEPMTKIHKVTADNMSRCWLNVPHVTQFDDADVTQLEEYRAMLKAEGAHRGVKMTPVAFILKLVATALAENPKFNSSIHQDGQTIVYREYCHLGLAVDTPAGLMVPVIKDADKKDIWQLAEEILELANKAKDGKLKPNEMQGASFTISSLGAIGGRGFTPIVPAPQVGILGVSKTSIQPVWDGSQFVPRKMMPLALSYDHRAVNGGDAGRFLTRLVELMGSSDNLWS